MRNVYYQGRNAMSTFEDVRKALSEVLVPEIRQLGECIGRLEAGTTALHGEISGLRRDIAHLAAKLDYAQRVARLEEQVALLMRRGG
jgi:predicted RNase H-like nuclease (RuvC/YqgF family)